MIKFAINHPGGDEAAGTDREVLKHLADNWLRYQSRPEEKILIGSYDVTGDDVEPLDGWTIEAFIEHMGYSIKLFPEDYYGDKRRQRAKKTQQATIQRGKGSR